MLRHLPVSGQVVAYRDAVESGAMLAEATFDLVAAYDGLRLSTYRDKGPRRDLICVASMGSATLLRFDDVGYFNRVYGNDDVIDRLESIEGFFHGSPHGCTLVPHTLSAAGAVAGACWPRGWRPDVQYVWLAGTDLSPGSSDDFEIRPPAEEEKELFLSSYLAGFGAAPERHAMAIENMRHLFSLPDLYFLFAFRGRAPAGVAMMYRRGDSALLCAGVTLASHRGQHCHEALLAARIRLARDLGCTQIHSWAFAGGRSHSNMERAGLRAVSTTRAWKFSPRDV